MTSKRRQNIARAASREAANMRANGSGPQLIRPAFLGVDAGDWTDLPPAQYPPESVEFIRLALTAGDQRKTLDAFRCDACHGVTVTAPTVALAFEKLYFFEKACGMSGYALGVNPFDQPGVEAYKKNMFALLGKPGYKEQGEELRKRL